jgi:hypothetical protein
MRISAAVLGACGARTSLVDDVAGLAMAGASSGVAGPAVLLPMAGASNASGGFEQGSATGGAGASGAAGSESEAVRRWPAAQACAAVVM